MRYIMNEDDLRGFAGYIGAETRVKGKELQFRFCPYCGSSAPADDEWKFGVNRITGAFGCLRASCAKRGHFVEMCRDFGYKLGMEVEREFTQFPQPQQRIIPRESAIAYLASRGISRAVAERYEVTAFENKPNLLWFPFFDEYGKLVYAKFRKMDYKKGRDKAKEWTQAGGKPILFGMKQCDSSYTTLVITEGQLDSLSVAEAGIPNACSVPNGCNAFTWIPYCRDWLKQFDRIVVFGDLEHGKMTLIDTIRQRLEDLPCEIASVRPEDYLGEKDANDILRNFGTEAVRRCIENAEVTGLNNVIDLADVKYINIAQLPKIRTGIHDIDHALKGGICLGQVLLLTGKRGDGKSTLASQFMANALDQGFGCFAYSGELPAFHFKGWLNYQLAGRHRMSVTQNEFGDDEYYLDPDTDKAISEWYRGRAFIYDNAAIGIDDEIESITKTVEKVAAKKNIKLFLIDNLMTAMEEVDDNNNLNLAQSNFVNQLKQIAIRYDVVIILIAHPRKSGANDSGSFDNDFVSGSSNITNRVDIVMNYERAKDDSGCDSKLQISKNRLSGILKLGKDAIPLNYSPVSKRVFCPKSLEKVYGWEREPIPVEDIDVPF